MRILIALATMVLAASSAHAAQLSTAVFATASQAARAAAANRMGVWLHTIVPAAALTVKQVSTSPAGRATRHLVSGTTGSMQVSVLQVKAGFRAFALGEYVGKPNVTAPAE